MWRAGPSTHIAQMSKLGIQCKRGVLQTSQQRQDIAKTLHMLQQSDIVAI